MNLNDVLEEKKNLVRSKNTCFSLSESDYKKLKYLKKYHKLTIGDIMWYALKHIKVPENYSEYV